MSNTSPAGKSDPNAMAEARAQAANVLHWLARVAHSYIDPEPEGGHVRLKFDPVRRAFRTRAFAANVSLEMRLPALELQFREGEKLVPHVLHVEGHSPAKIEAWVLVELLHRGIDRDRFSKELPYDVATLMSGDHVEFAPDQLADELTVLSNWLGDAEQILTPIAEANGIGGELQCWPDQFHVGVVLPLEPGGVIRDKALRVGLSLGDERCADPYYFVAVQNKGALEITHPGCVVTASRRASEGLDAKSVIEILRGAIATTRSRLAH